MAWLIFLFHIVLYIEASEGLTMAKPGCPDKCGAVEIPYPFGIGPNCSLNEEGFELTCKEDDDKSVPFAGNVEVLNITLATAEARVYNQISWQCYQGPNTTTDLTTWMLDLNNTVYTLSTIHNMFTVIGCETLAFNVMQDYKNYTCRTGCVSTCYTPESLTNGTCSGNGCCQTSIPSGISSYVISFDSKYNNSQVWNFIRCSYAVVMAADSFSFDTSYIYTTAFLTGHKSVVPVVLDWSIGTESCDVAKARSNYSCVSNNSMCINSKDGAGYFCNCLTGYRGNPYLPDGCQDINECIEYPSICNGSRVCENTQGGYQCNCPKGAQSDMRKDGNCSDDNRALSPQSKLAIGVSMGLLLLLLCLFGMHVINERRMLARIREKYFQQYGGRLLLDEMKGNHGYTFTLFTEQELKEATNNFHESNTLGHGGNGTVYKGTLKNNIDVAIKKCKIIDERNKKEFGKEMLILSEINHRNIVRILGCCLEVDIPILVYEFIPKGTLFDLIHSTSHILLSIRLRIAQEAAEALAYLHSWASPPIVHCDVKSANILLDENYVTKVSDFGASALAPSDEDQFLTMVQGTHGYLDPQCMQTGQLTVKSDVYSFDVVLLELLTRKKPFYLVGTEERSLSLSFLTAMKESKLHEISDEHILDEENLKLIEGVAELATECLNMEGEKRPEMREVAERLDKLRKAIKHPLGINYHYETASLLGEPSSNLEFEMTSHRSLENKAMLAMDTGW